jgi:hypothetical protein
MNFLMQQNSKTNHFPFLLRNAPKASIVYMYHLLTLNTDALSIAVWLH